MMSQGICFEYSVLTDWYDTGNKDSYYKMKEVFKPNYEVLEKTNETLCFIENKVIKFVNDENINIKRIIRGVSLYPLTPKIEDACSNFIQMELINGCVLSEVRRKRVIYDLLKWAKTNLWVKSNTNSQYIECCKRFYISKTLKRINELSFLGTEQNIINGLDCNSAHVLINNIPEHVLCTDTFMQFHGDFILDNILLENTNEFRLIDWRHEFDDEILFGDMYYDLAKLRHNMILNHKNINNGLFEINYEENNVFVDLKCNYFHLQQMGDYEMFMNENGYSMRKIKILTALIWLNMAPLYSGKFSEFLFYFGKYNLALSLREHYTRP